MKKRFLKLMAAAGVAVCLGACSDDSGSNGNDTPANGNGTVNACAGYTVFHAGWILELAPGEYWVIDKETATSGQGVIYDKTGNVVAGNFFTVDEAGIGHIFDAEGPFVDVNMAVQTFCEANAYIDPGTGDVVIVSSSSVASGDPTSSAATVPGSSGSLPASSGAVNPGSSTNSGDPTSSGAVNPGSSGSVVPGSSADVIVESSSSKDPDLDENGFPTLESYGDPPAAYTKNILDNGQTGWNSRYWDACKPHCAWISNGQEGKTDTTTEESYQAGMTTARNCNIHDVEVPTYTVGSGVGQYWFGYEGTNNACGNAKEKGVFTCTDMAPIAVNDTLSYAYVAGPGSQTTCGKCFHLQYNGSFKDASANNAAKETHKALKGKHMVVMTSNIGHDVERGQFDLMVPGGGVGAFDALSVQVSGQNVEWGAGFGGFLTACQGKHGYDNTLEVYQQCVRDMCDAAFGNAGFPNLLRGCHWFADWFMAADNPTYNWEEVECPQYLIDHYMTRINTHKDNNYKWRDDWSTFKEGDVLDTAKCWKDGENPYDPNGKGAGCEK